MSMKKKITTVLKDGSKKEFDVMFTFKNECNDKNYVVYTDNSIDQDNKLRVYASIYNPITLEFLGVPTSKEEWSEIYRLLDNLLLNK